MIQTPVSQCVLSLCMLFAGCTANDSTVVADVTGYNHTGRDIKYFTINNVTGAFVARHGASETPICCVAVPREYQPGFKVTVSWSDDSVQSPRTLTAALPPYAPGRGGGHFSIHFLRDGDVKVFVVEY